MLPQNHKVGKTPVFNPPAKSPIAKASIAVAAGAKAAGNAAKATGAAVKAAGASAASSVKSTAGAAKANWKGEDDSFSKPEYSLKHPVQAVDKATKKVLATKVGDGVGQTLATAALRPDLTAKAAVKNVSTQYQKTFDHPRLDGPKDTIKTHLKEGPKAVAKVIAGATGALAPIAMVKGAAAPMRAMNDAARLKQDKQDKKTTGGPTGYRAG